MKTGKRIFMALLILLIVLSAVYLVAAENDLCMHDWILYDSPEDEEYVAPTCTSVGSCLMECSICHVKTKKTLEKAPHETDTRAYITIVQPTCERGMYEIRKCRVCGQYFEVDYFDPNIPNIIDYYAPLGHRFATTSEVIYSPTCTKNGVIGKPCLNGCGAFLDGETIPATGHNEGDEGYCVNCGQDLHTSERCKFCGKIHNGGFFDKLTGFFHKIFAIFKR